MTNAQQSLVWRITISICSILGALAEAQDDILDAITANAKVTHFLLSLLAREIIDRDALDECLSAALILTEDNRPLAEAVVASPAFDILMKQKRLDGTTSVLVCGVLHNVFSAMGWGDNSPGKGGATDEMLIRRLARTLQDYQPGEVTPGDAEWTCPDEIASLALEILASIASGVQDTMSGEKESRPVKEVNGKQEEDEDEDEDMVDDGVDEDANLVAGEDSDRELDDDDSGLDTDDMEEDMERVTGAGDEDEEASGTEHLPTLEAFLKRAMPQVLRLASPSSKSETPSDVQNHAVSVLNNLAWSLACVEFGNGLNESLLKAWVPYGKAIWEAVVTEILDSDTNDLDLATELTSLAWAVAKALGPAYLPLKEGQHRKFISLYLATKSVAGDGEKNPADPEDPFQAIGVKCIGVLGHLALDPAPIPLNREIGVFLVTVVSSLPQTATAEAIEALNQLIDIYGDEEAACDAVFWEDGFLKPVEAALPKSRTMLKGIHKNDPKTKELRERAEEVVMNLERFIQYKRKHKPGKEQ